MGKPKLVWSLIQLRVVNQYKIYPIERMEKVEVNLDGVKSTIDFEVIETIDETYPYLALLGINRAFDNNAILNLKNRKMSLDLDTMILVTPLDPCKGERCIEPIKEELEIEEIDNLYNITTRREDYANPTIDGELS